MTAPMDPKHLAELRRWIDSGRFPSFAELLADRDHWHAIAVRAAVEAQEAHASAARAEAEAKRYRSRCPVTAEDVERAGITWVHVADWVRANPTRSRAESEHVPQWADGPDDPRLRDLVITVIALAVSLARYAGDDNVCQLDIFDEMAAIEVQP